MSRKKLKDKKFYVNEIGVLDWLKSDDEDTSQVHRFSDRIEYKKNYVLHREDGPAIEYFSKVGDQYYDNGKRLTKEEFKNLRRTKLIGDMTNDN